MGKPALLIGQCLMESKMRTQLEKAKTFRALHERPGAFIIPNPWDAGTARLLAAMGFEALATTSLGVANTLGSATVSLTDILENCRAIADATDLPVNAECNGRSSFTSFSVKPSLWHHLMKSRCSKSLVS